MGMSELVDIFLELEIFDPTDIWWLTGDFGEGVEIAEI
jgi:hypothetical protein